MKKKINEKFMGNLWKFVFTSSKVRQHAISEICVRKKQIPFEKPIRKIRIIRGSETINRNSFSDVEPRIKQI